MTIAEKLKSFKETGEKALAVFSTVGDPDFETSVEIFQRFGDSGADILELGIPYSDPLMDGPVLQRSYSRALNRGFKIATLPSFAEAVRKKSDTPMLVMTCFNPVFRYGVNRFYRDISNAGIDSVLITDLPPEEWGESIEIARSHNIGTIFLLAPTTPIQRMELINNVSIPFVYCISRTGVTGPADLEEDSLSNYLKFVREVVKKPIMVGFGVHEPKQAELIGRYADGVIVGSAISTIIERHLGSPNRTTQLLDSFVSGLKQVMKP